jgi:hypothetical protein
MVRGKRKSLSRTKAKEKEVDDDFVSPPKRQKTVKVLLRPSRSVSQEVQGKLA